jgi:hypothetical protein
LYLSLAQVYDQPGLDFTPNQPSGQFVNFLTHQILQWFVTEQLEEVATMSDLLNVTKRAGDDLFRIEEYLVQNPHEAEAGGEAE